MAGEGNGDEGWRQSGIEVSALQFAYDGQPPLFARFNLRVAPGSRCLLVGANGSGMYAWHCPLPPAAVHLMDLWVPAVYVYSY